MWWSCKVSPQSKLFWFTKVPQNHPCRDQSLSKSTLPTVSFWSQILWTCSNPKLMTLKQVVHQGEWVCIARSRKTHFCWFLGFTKVALATFPKWAQNWWKALIICVISPCGVSCQMESIFLPWPTTNTFCQFSKSITLTPSTNLHEPRFLP